MIKKKWLVMLTVVSSLLICKSIFAQDSKTQAYQPPLPSEIKLSNNVILYKNIRYASIPEMALDSNSDRILDLYLPQNGQNKQALPVFLFIHGGGFSGGDKDMKDICSKMALHGFAVVSINYRLTLKYTKKSGASCSANMAKGLPQDGKFHPFLKTALENASEDAVMALGWISENSAKYNMDSKNLAVCGGSAGSMTALHLAYESGQKVLPIKAVIDFWGGLEDVSVIKKGAPVLLTYHGDKDAIINVAYAYALQERMAKIGSDKSQFKILKDQGHALYRLMAAEKMDEIAAFIKAAL